MAVLSSGIGHEAHAQLFQVAQGHVSALERLIDAYAMIGEAIPRFDRLSIAFKNDTEFMSVMGFFYSDILEFHRRCRCLLGFCVLVSSVIDRFSLQILPATR